MSPTIRVTIALSGLLFLTAANGQENRHRWSVELALDATSSEASGKLSASPDGEFARLAFEYSGSIKPTLTFNAVIDAVDDGTPGIDVTEAFLHWQPVPRSPFRHELRAGAFYPPMSLENTGPAWTSPYATSFSAINTWIGEEIRTTGAEWSVNRALGPRAGQREIRMLGAAFYGNDPAGTLLAWRGWALHQRQSRVDDAIVLPAVPQIQPDGWFRRQAPATRPFDEVDHSPGFYYGAEWRLGRRILLAAMHYDNHADPEDIREGQYGWTTRFDHLGAQFELPSDLGLIVQWMDGTTEMGPYINGARAVHNGFDAWFALLTQKRNRHRWSMRFDDFKVSDIDSTPMDNNAESGQALTLAWRYEPETSWSVGLEWIALDVNRPAFGYFGLPATMRENLTRFELRYRLRSQPR